MGLLRALLVPVVTLCLAGCASQKSLLEQGGSLSAGQPSLVMPPQDALSKADPSAPDSDELGPGETQPILGEASSAFPVFDADRNAAALSAEQQGAPAGSAPLWRGRLGADGVDVVNANGVLCSGPGRGSPQVLACSDGRLAHLNIFGNSTSGTVRFGETRETVRFER